jgi:hypothetical protein
MIEELQNENAALKSTISEVAELKAQLQAIQQQLGSKASVK